MPPGTEAEEEAAATTARVESLFQRLDEALRASSWTRAASAADAVLAVLPSDADALRAKASALLHSSPAACVALIDAATPELRASVAVERACALHRLGRCGEALDSLRADGGAAAAGAAAPGSSPAAPFLLAQLLLRSGDAGGCAAALEAAAAQVRRDTTRREVTSTATPPVSSH